MTRASRLHAVSPALRGNRRGGPARALALTAGWIVAAWLPAVAHAESPVVTMQARAANAEFLAFAPPPPGGAAAVCLVDSGVDLNPDTASNVVHREAVDGGEPGDVRPGKHGTSMAMTMGAPVNDWGGVGAWPHVRIVSIRALPPGEEAFPFHLYEQAVIRCDKAAGPRRVVVVNLSLGGGGADADSIARLRDRFRSAQGSGMSIVAAAGNRGGAVEYPAAIPEAFGVTGADAAGALCTFSARGPGVDLVAPGCGLDVALPDGRPARANGTSDAAAFVSAVLAALRSHRPDLSPLAAERLLVGSARSVDGRPVLDVEAAFHAAGLHSVVESGRSATPAGVAPPSSPPPPGAGRLPGRVPRAARPPRPRLRSVRLRRRTLVVRTAGRPAGARLRARLTFRGSGEFSRRYRTVERRSSALRIRLPSRWRRLELRYRAGSGSSAPRVITQRDVRRGGSNRRRDRRR